MTPPGRQLSSISAELLLGRHRNLLVSRLVLPHAQRILFVTVALWYSRPGLSLAQCLSVIFFASLIAWSWLALRHSYELQCLSLEEVLTRAVSLDEDRRWEELYIRARAEGYGARSLFERAEPWVWWVAACLAACSALPSKVWLS